MTLAWKSIVCFFAVTWVAQTSVGQGLIPPPGPQRAGYYIEFSDTTTLPPGGPQGVAPAAWQSAASPVPVPVPTDEFVDQPGVAPAECSDFGQLWAGACDAAGVEGCDGACETGCNSCCGLWSHRTSVYASMLYMRPRNADVPYAVPINGPITGDSSQSPLQIGGIGVVDPDYETGFAAGVSVAVDPVTSLFVQVMMLDWTTSNRIGTEAPNVLRSLVAHPSSESAASDFLSATADLTLQMDLVDAGLKHLFVGGDVYAVNYVLGARYGRLEQTFASIFVDNGTEQVSTNIDFDGAGLMLGLEAERKSCSCGLSVYARGAASFLAGKFQGNYFQGQSFDPTVVNTSWEAGRVVPILDLELGTGWISPCGKFRVSAGYLVSAWFNTVTTDDFIRSVQSNDFNDLGSSMTFDGLRAQAEWRF